jgi:hypothetical protein
MLVADSSAVVADVKFIDRESQINAENVLTKSEVKDLRLGYSDPGPPRLWQVAVATDEPQVSD